MTEIVDCPWCEKSHQPIFACLPAQAVLNRLHQQVMEGAAKYDMPTMEFTNEVGDQVEGILCKALSVRAFYTDTLSIYRPGIAIDPVMLDDSRIKPLILIDDDINMRRIGRLFDNMTSLAVRRAKKARDEEFRHRRV